MAVPVPPNVPTDPPAPPGILEKPVLTTGAENARLPICRACPRLVMGVSNQMRLKAALPESKASMESSSRYASTLGGEIQPIHRLACCQDRIAAGLFTLFVRSGSMIRPPPDDACHSRALHVKASPASSPARRNPKNPSCLWRAHPPEFARPCSRVRSMSGEDDHSRIRAADPFDTPSRPAGR